MFSIELASSEVMSYVTTAVNHMGNRCIAMAGAGEYDGVFFGFFFLIIFFLLCFDFHRKVRTKIYRIWCRFFAADIPVESCRIVARKFLQQFRNMCTNLKGSRPFIELKEACIIILNGSLNVFCCQKDSSKDVSLNNPGEKRCL